MDTESKKELFVAKWIGLFGAVLAFISLLIPYAKDYDDNASLVKLAKMYIESDSSVWNDKAYETFYRIFVPVMVGLIVIFTLIYIIKCLKKRPVGMIVSLVLTIIIYEALKWDFADRRVVPGACDKGIAFTIIYIAFAIMLVGIIMSFIEKSKIKKMQN